MEKELCKIFYFNPVDYDNRGRRKSDGKTFRDVIKEFEYDFHDTYSAEYALNLYANSLTMALLAKSNDAAPFLMYGMDLTQGKSFDATQDPFVNHEMEKYSQNIYVYGIDSAFMTEFDEYGYPILDEDSDIFPLTLLVDNTMRDNEVRLAVPTVDGGAETWSSFVYVNGDEYKVYCENDDFYNIRAEDENCETIASYTSDVDDSDTFIEDFAKRLLNRYGEINTGV